MCPVCIECCHLYDREIDMSRYCNSIMTDASTAADLIRVETNMVTFDVLLNRLGEKPTQDTVCYDRVCRI